MGIDLVVLGFPAMDSFHVEGMTEDKFDLFFAAEVGKPVPGKHAFHADHQVVAERRHCFEKGLWRAGNVAVQEHLALRAQDAEKHLLTAGADSVVSPYSFAGQRIAQSFLRPHVVSFLDTATTHLGLDLEIGEIAISHGSSFAGKTIESSRIRQERGVIVLAIKKENGMHFNPSPDDRIEVGDCLIAMGEPAQLRQLEQLSSTQT